MSLDVVGQAPSPQPWLRPGARFEVSVHSDSEYFWSSYLFCGLFDLVAEGEVRVKFLPRFSLTPDEIFGTELIVRDRRLQRSKRIVFDWRDNPDLLCLNKLARSDVYFKRNFIPEITLPACPTQDRHKLRPAGLSFAVRTFRERPWWMLVAAAFYSLENPVFDGGLRQVYRRLRQGFVRGPRRALTLRREQDFRVEEPSPQPVVLFQTRCYDPGDTLLSEDTRAVSEERAIVIRALKRAFGAQFIGGFVPSAYALKNYPDCVAASGEDEREYLELMKNSLVCVSTRGLRDSPGFKLGEYLAAGRCVVSEPLRTQLPRGLENGKEALFFSQERELVEHCQRILDDERLQKRLGERARLFYESEVSPKQRVLRCLEEAFAAE